VGREFSPRVSPSFSVRLPLAPIPILELTPRSSQKKSALSFQVLMGAHSATPLFSGMGGTPLPTVGRFEVQKASESYPLFYQFLPDSPTTDTHQILYNQLATHVFHRNGGGNPLGFEKGAGNGSRTHSDKLHRPSPPSAEQSERPSPNGAMLRRAFGTRRFTLPFCRWTASGPRRARTPAFRLGCLARRGYICPSPESAGPRGRCFFRDAEGLH
jgi:hypothetical protein